MKRIHQFKGHKQGSNVTVLAVLDEHSVLASGAEDGTVRLWDRRNGNKAVKVFNVGCVEAISSIAKSEETQQLYFSHGRFIRSFDLRNASLVQKQENCLSAYNLNQDEINQIQIQGNRLLSCDDSGAVLIVDLAEKKLIKTLSKGGHENICACAAFNPTSPTQVLSGGYDCRLILWNSRKGKVLRKSNENERKPGSQVVNPPFVCCMVTRDREVFIGRGDGVVRAYDINRWNVTKTLECHHSAVTSLDLLPKKEILVTAGNDCYLALWNTALSSANARWKGKYTSKINWVASERAENVCYVAAQSDLIEVFEIE